MQKKPDRTRKSIVYAPQKSVKEIVEITADDMETSKAEVAFVVKTIFEKWGEWAKDPRLHPAIRIPKIGKIYADPAKLNKFLRYYLIPEVKKNPTEKNKAELSKLWELRQTQAEYAGYKLPVKKHKKNDNR